MTGDEYRTHMDLLAAACRTLLLLPVDELLATVQHAETVGPILEPTAFLRGGGDNLAAQREVLEAAQALCRVAERYQAPRVGGGEVVVADYGIDGDTAIVVPWLGLRGLSSMSVHRLLVTASVEDRMRMWVAVGPYSNWIDGRSNRHGTETWLVTVLGEHVEYFLDVARRVPVTVEEVEDAGDDERYRLVIGEPGTGWGEP